MLISTMATEILMRYVSLPRTSLTVSAVCLGVGSHGVISTEPEAFAVFDRFLELGGNFFETARVYSDWVPGERGRSERILGDWIAARKNRDRLVLATKGGHRLIGIPDASLQPRLSAAELRTDLMASAAALRTETIDLYYLHRDDETIPVAEIIDTLEQFVAEGRIRAYGCSNWSPERIDLAMQYAAAHHRTGFAANQMEWHLAVRHAGPMPDPTMRSHTDEAARVMLKHQITAIPETTQADGFFSMLMAGGAAREAALNTRFSTPNNMALFDDLTAISEKHDVPLEALVLGFFALYPGTVIPQVDPHTLDHLNATLRAITTPLSAACLRDLSQAVAR